MTSETKEQVENALQLLAVELTPAETLKKEFQPYREALHKCLIEDILKENYFEVDDNGKIFSTTPPIHEDGSDLKSFLRANKISVSQPERKTLSQLMEAKKQTIWKHVFK